MQRVGATRLRKSICERTYSNRNVGGGLRSQRVLTNGYAQRRTVLWRGRAILSRLDTPEALMRRCMRHRASDNRFRFLGTDVGARMV